MLRKEGGAVGRQRTLYSPELPLCPAPLLTCGSTGRNNTLRSRPGLLMPQTMLP